jgi:monoamine oxidase
MSTDVVIVGGGFSGLAAARTLHRAGVSFVLVEARDRLGGRTYTRHPGQNMYLDVGGMWIGPTQDRMYALAREAGLSWYETYNEGKNILDLNGKVRTYRGLIPKMDVVSLLNTDYAIRKLERLARSVNTRAPWQHRHAPRWDGISLAGFLRTTCRTKNSYQVMRAGLETVFACELNEVSLLHALFYIRSGTNLSTLLNIRQGAQQHRIAGGMQPLADRLANPFRGSIRLNHAVERINTHNEHAEVIGKNFHLSAKRIIMAVPPLPASQISFNPPLPLTKRQMLQRLPMGIVGKVMAIYPTPFWRAQGKSGQVVADDTQPFQTVFDGSPADAAYGVLVGFCLANRAREYFSRHEEERKRRALVTFSRYFGSPAAAPVYFTDHCWADEPWSAGGYAAVYPTGAWTNLQNGLAECTGRIHWAGTETSAVWYGYIEGAVRTGEREAEAVITALK